MDDTCCSEVCGEINHVVLLHLVYEHRNGAIGCAFNMKNRTSSTQSNKINSLSVKIDSLEADLFGFTTAFLSMPLTLIHYI